MDIGSCKTDANVRFNGVQYQIRLPSSITILENDNRLSGSKKAQTNQNEERKSILFSLGIITADA